MTRPIRSYKSLDGRTTPLLGGTNPSTPQPASPDLAHFHALQDYGPVPSPHSPASPDLLSNPHTPCSRDSQRLQSSEDTSCSTPDFTFEEQVWGPCRAGFRLGLLCFYIGLRDAQGCQILHINTLPLRLEFVHLKVRLAGCKRCICFLQTLQSRSCRWDKTRRLPYGREGGGHWGIGASRICMCERVLCGVSVAAHVPLFPQTVQPWERRNFPLVEDPGEEQEDPGSLEGERQGRGIRPISGSRLSWSRSESENGPSSPFLEENSKQKPPPTQR